MVAQLNSTMSRITNAPFTELSTSGGDNVHPGPVHLDSALNPLPDHIHEGFAIDHPPTPSPCE